MSDAQLLCPVCGESDSVPRLAGLSDVNFGNYKGVGRLNECLRCTAMYLDRNSMSVDPSVAYNKYYTAEKVKLTSKSRGGIFDLTKALVLKVLRGPYSRRGVTVHDSKVLDFGCGSFQFLVEILRIFPHLDLHGCDIGDVSNNCHRIKYHQLPLDSYSGPSFSRITAGHVIEHMSCPDELFGSCLPHLATGGKIWIATPNKNSWIILVFGRYARDIDYPRHKILYSEDSLKLYAKAHNMQVIIRRGPKINEVLCSIQSFKNLYKVSNTGARSVSIMVVSAIRSIFYILCAWSTRRSAELVCEFTVAESK